MVYQFDVSRQRLTAVQYIDSHGAKAVQSLTVHSVNYVVFANSFDSVSQSYEI